MNKKTFRYQFGLFLILLSFVCPLLGFLVPLLNLSSAVNAALIAGLMVGAPEVLLILGAALSGREALETIKKWFSVCFFRKKAPKPISLFRFRLGVIFLLVGILANWFLQYFGLYLNATKVQRIELLVTIIFFDIVTISSLFMLGGPFWEKLKCLFTYDG